MTLPSHMTQTTSCTLTTRTTFIAIARQLAAHLQSTSEPRLALDLETTGLDPWKDGVVTIACGSTTHVTIFDVRPYYQLDEAEQQQWREALQAVLCQPHLTWTGHNLKFDWLFLKVYFGLSIARVYDTMLVEMLLTNSKTATHKGAISLQETARRYDLSVSKEERSWFIGLHHTDAWYIPFPEQQLTYIMQDIRIPFAIAEQQQAAISLLHLEEVVALEHEALPAIASMEAHGTLIDLARWKEVLNRKRTSQATLEHELVQEFTQALTQKQASGTTDPSSTLTEQMTYQYAVKAQQQALMREYAATDIKAKLSWNSFYQSQMKTWQEQHPRPGITKPQPTLNLGSPAHLLEALHALDLPVLSTKEEDLSSFVSSSPLVSKLLAWKELKHFCSAFGDNILAHRKADGRIHASFSQLGAASGRIICHSPNLQQIPKPHVGTPEEEDLRRCFIAPARHVLLKADLSNIELRILAEITQDTTMLRLFAEGKDLHAETAKLMFHLAPETDTKKHLFHGVVVRDIAKAINFGLVYGMGAQGLANRIGVCVEEAKNLMQTYFSTYQGVAIWLKRTPPLALKQGYSTTLAGRRRFLIPARTSEIRAQQERIAKNHPIQGTNADILKRALALLYQRLPNDCYTILTVHDEIVLECSEALIAEAQAILRESMVEACRLYLPTVHIPAPDILVAPYWQKD